MRRLGLVVVLLALTAWLATKSDPGSCCSVALCGGFCAPSCCEENQY